MFSLDVAFRELGYTSPAGQIALTRKDIFQGLTLCNQQ
jgi:hypothetical protein